MFHCIFILSLSVIVPQFCPILLCLTGELVLENQLTWACFNSKGIKASRLVSLARKYISKLNQNSDAAPNTQEWLFPVRQGCISLKLVLNMSYSEHLLLLGSINLFFVYEKSKFIIKSPQQVFQVQPKAGNKKLTVRTQLQLDRINL